MSFHILAILFYFFGKIYNRYDYKAFKDTYVLTTSCQATEALWAKQLLAADGVAGCRNDKLLFKTIQSSANAAINFSLDG